jgi:hypothetical protein
MTVYEMGPGSRAECLARLMQQKIQKFNCESLEERDHFTYVFVERLVVLKWILSKKSVKLWTEITRLCRAVM